MCCASQAVLCKMIVYCIDCDAQAVLWKCASQAVLCKLQGKCHATSINKDGSISKTSCTQTYTDSTGNSIVATGILELADGRGTYAILGGTGEYMGAYGEAHVTYHRATMSVLGETVHLYSYDVCLYTPAAKRRH